MLIKVKDIQIELKKRNSFKKLYVDILFYKDIVIQQNMYFERNGEI